MRFIGLDVHRDFCEVAIAEDGRVRSAGRIETSVEQLELFARSLGADAAVALEATSGAAKIAKLIEPHVARVVVANTRKLAAISQAKAKTDRLDARTLARMLASGYLWEVWTPDEKTRALRRLTGRRARLVRARTRAKNEAHAVLTRNLCGRAPVVHLFSKAGRRWLGELELPVDERLTLEGCLRQIDFLDGEITALEAVLAAEALDPPEIRRLLTIPGVNLLTAAAFMASVGEIERFSSPRRLSAISGSIRRCTSPATSRPATGGPPRQAPRRPGICSARSPWKVSRTPGPLRAFFERVRARRGPQVAATATARKLAVLFWHLLTREEDYAFQRPSMTRNKIRQLELAAGAPRRKGSKGVAGGKSRQVWDSERELSRQAEVAYRRLTADWQQRPKRGKGAGATPERASDRPSSRQAARQGSAPEPAL